MKLENIKFGVSSISNRIYAGELSKNQSEWKNKVDIPQPLKENYYGKSN